MKKFVEALSPLAPVIVFLFWTSVICYALYAFFFNFIDYGFLHSEITAYPIYYDSNGKEADTAIIFKVYPDQQTVTFIEGTLIGKLNDCVIQDRTNWHCDGYYAGEVGFTNGKYFDTSWDSSIHFVSKVEWTYANHNSK